MKEYYNSEIEYLQDVNAQLVECIHKMVNEVRAHRDDEEVATVARYELCNVTRALESIAFKHGVWCGC